MAFTQKQGLLIKRGHVWKNWKWRWFILDEQMLKYYSVAGHLSPDTAPSESDLELKGSVILGGGTVEEAEPKISELQKFCFKLTPENGAKVFYIAAQTETEKQEWMTAISSHASASMEDNVQQSPVEKELEPEQVFNYGSGEKITLAHFELMKVIGRGAYGKVMQVRRSDTGEIFAMKVLKKDTVFKRGDPKDIQHTLSERRVLEAVNATPKGKHPFLVAMRFAFQTSHKLYYVLDFCNGGDLYNLLCKVKRFTEDEARFYSAEILSALDHIHRMGIIYRDLKPENVLLDSQGHVCLTDFGLSFEGTSAYTFCGTPVYLAPEIWTRQRYGTEVDWWSLGCMIYEMITGCTPFWGDNIKEVYTKVLSQELKFPKSMSKDAKDLIEQLLERDPKKRLGAGEADAEPIKAHFFYKKIKWEDLMQKKLKAPYKSQVKNETDTANFQRIFTNEKVQDSVVEKSMLSLEQQEHFQGFTYMEKSHLVANSSS